MTKPDDDLTEAVRASLRTQASQIAVTDQLFDPGQPGHGLSLEDAGSNGSHVRQRVLVAVAAGIVLILAVGAFAVTRSTDQGDVEVAAGNELGLHHVLPPLAPTGVEWFVSAYSPTDAFGSPAWYAVDFELDGFTWELIVGTSGPNPDEHPVTIGDRAVSIFADGRPAGEVAAAFWREPSGDLVQLGALPTLAPDGTTGAKGRDARPTSAQVAAVVERIQPVDDATWLAALDPPDGAVDPSLGWTSEPPPDAGTARPLHLGLDAPPARTHLALQPWHLAQSLLDIDGFEPGAFRLSTTTIPVLGRAPLLPAVELVTVRGVEGQVETEGTTADDPTTGTPGSTGFPTWPGPENATFNRSISWTEGGSDVRLDFTETTAVEEAVLIANSLVVLDDAQWTALLFPDGSASPEPIGPSAPLAPLRTRLELASTTVPAGTSLEGQVIVNNDTGEAIDVQGCVTPFNGAVANDTIELKVTSLLCLDTFVIPEGESTWPVTLGTSYGSCTNEEGDSLEEVPDCLPGPTAPPLPPGLYTATIHGPSPLPPPSPVDVTLT